MSRRRSRRWSWCWTRFRAVSPASVKIAFDIIIPAPDNHFIAGPNCRVIVSGTWRAGGVGSDPNIRIRIVSAAGVEKAIQPQPAPDDHFTAGPHRRVIASGTWRTDGAGSCPTINARIVPPASVHIAAIISPQAIISLPLHTAV
jgi:hypothetical protein